MSSANFCSLDVLLVVGENSSVTTDMEDEDTLRKVVDRLQEKFPELPREKLEEAAKVEFDELAGRPVHDYLSILTERAAKKRLKREGSASVKS